MYETQTTDVRYFRVQVQYMFRSLSDVQINGIVGFNFAPIKDGLAMRFSTPRALIQVLGIHTRFGLIPIRKPKSLL